MKNILLQHWAGPLGELEKLSIENMKQYADWCGVEYRLLTGYPLDATLAPQSQKIYALTEEFDDYDTVVMLDTDMFVNKNNRKNIFTDDTGVGRHYGIQETLRKGVSRIHPFLGDVRYPYWGGSIYRLEKSVREKLRPHMNMKEMIQFNKTYHDEGIMHRLAVLSQFPEKGAYLDRQQWNYSSFDEGVEDSYIIHIRPKVKQGGPKRPKIENYKALVERGLI
jgi:hypothetical protein